MRAHHLATLLTGAVAALAALMAGTSSGSADDPAPALATEAPVLRAVAVLHPTRGNTAQGIVRFERLEDGIRVVGDFTGLAQGDHGFHVHELGDCSDPDALSAGEHFNPERESHGPPASMARHVGDLGNVRAGADGAAHYEWTDPLLAFEGSHDIIGRSVVIHAGPDDLASEPDGLSGPRVACGVIGIAGSDAP